MLDFEEVPGYDSDVHIPACMYNKMVAELHELRKFKASATTREASIARRYSELIEEVRRMRAVLNKLVTVHEDAHGSGDIEVTVNAAIVHKLAMAAMRKQYSAEKLSLYNVRDSLHIVCSAIAKSKINVKE